MGSLANKTIASTYDGLVKTSTEDAVPASGQQLLQDGTGNSLALSVGRANNGISVTGDISASGSITNNGISVTGDIDASGSITAGTGLTATNGIYVGGTWDAHYMQEYYDSSTVNISVQHVGTSQYALAYAQGVISYTRIGDVVHCWGKITLFALYGDAYVFGVYLPYSRVSGGNTYVFGEITKWSGISLTYPKLELGQSTSLAEFILNSSGSSTPQSSPIFVMQNSPVNLEFQISYQVS